ncbi:MAG: hypothetical protein WDW36_004622 [Sanguina aurantia]
MTSILNDHPASAPAVAETRADHTTGPLRVLVADDDASSRRFFADGLATLGAIAASCADGREALARARANTFDLLLLDCRMPGAGALEILALLREDPTALSGDALAVATTAELAPADQQSLIAAGFSEVLMKPCGLAELRRMLTLPGRTVTAILDDRAALITSGDAATMRALRRLLREELTLLIRELDTLAHNVDAFGDRLHRLRSSCGFCGAATLSAQTALLQRQLTRAAGMPIPLTRFRQALLATVQALDR